MADLKISQLTGATTPLAGTEVLPIVQSSSTKKVAVSDLTAGRDVATAALLSTKTSAGAVVDVSTIQNLSSAAGTEAALFFAPTTATGNIRGARISAINDSNNIIGLKFYTGAGASLTSKLEIEGAAAGNVTLNTGNIVPGTAAKGINFTANTPAAGMTSQLLNWYEEGTFTPTVIGTTTAGTGTYSLQLGRYTRVGRAVYIQIQLAWSAHTGTGNMKVAGLPFTSNASVPSQLSIAAFNMAVTALNFPIARQEVSTTEINLLQSPTGGGAWSGIPMDTSVDALEISGSYTV
jgi:hypothetical protein